jgi:hypothetical protein
MYYWYREILPQHRLPVGHHKYILKMGSSAVNSKFYVLLQLYILGSNAQRRRAILFKVKI